MYTYKECIHITWVHHSYYGFIKIVGYRGREGGERSLDVTDNKGTKTGRHEVQIEGEY